MKRAMLFCSLTIMLALSSCILGYYETQRDYLKFQNYFPDFLFDNFPTKLSYEFLPFDILYPEGIELGVNYCGLFAMPDLNREVDFSGYLKNAKKIIDIYDSCTLRLSFKKRTGSNIYEDNHCLLYPIPNPNDSSGPLREYDFSEDTKAILLDYRKGQFLPEKFKSNNDYPLEWESGFSKGILIDETNKNIVYWLIVW